MATTPSASPVCKSCKYIMQITNTYCYHPEKYGSRIESPVATPAWCPLRHGKN